MADRPPTDAELDAAIAALSDQERLREAQELVMRTAPALQRVLAIALEDGGWFDLGHDQAVREATGQEDPGERASAVRTLLAEETRLGMLVGVAVGFELARELAPRTTNPEPDSTNPENRAQPAQNKNTQSPHENTQED